MKALKIIGRVIGYLILSVLLGGVPFVLLSILFQRFDIVLSPKYAEFSSPYCVLYWIWGPCFLLSFIILMLRWQGKFLEEKARRAMHDLRVLIVGAEMGLTYPLELMGWVITETDASAAEHQISEFQPDLIIVNGKNTGKVLENLGAVDRSEIPLLLVTKYCLRKEIREAAQRVGARIFPIPINTIELSLLVYKILRKADPPHLAQLAP